MSRVVLALDAAAPDLAAALRVLELTRLIGAAELEALLLEDEALRAILALPVVRQTSFSGLQGRVEGVQLRHELAAAAHRLDSEAQRAAGRLQLRFSSRSVHSQPAEALREATAQARLLVVQRGSGPLLGAASLRSAPLRILPDLPGDVLVLGAKRPLAPPLVAVLTDPDQVEPVLATASALRQVLGGSLELLVLGRSADEGRQLAAALRDHLPAGSRLVHGRAEDAPELVRVVATARPGTVILARSALEPAEVRGVLERLQAAVWLVGAG